MERRRLLDDAGEMARGAADSSTDVLAAEDAKGDERILQSGDGGVFADDTIVRLFIADGE